MDFVEDHLDLILVPAGLLIMFTYHLYLIYRIIRNPSTTAIGYQNQSRMLWVESMMQNGSSSLAVSVVSNNTWSAIYLGNITLSVSILIGSWVGSTSGSFSKYVFLAGNNSTFTINLKYICMLLAFMLAFGSFAQSAKYFIQIDYFISTPSSDLPVIDVQSAMLRANNFWQVGFRFVYFAMAFLFWSFGPIPMFASCVVMVVLLSFLDFNPARPVSKTQVKKVIEEVLHRYRPMGKPLVKKKVMEV
ncbi:hypothetical protein NE237_002613 [Protea cynaroides]|uniref:DUF599 domain-containing protein n=1 Tax=Protea cynaroides TaxID=273540 RepID=A0A9Q0KVK7_9MAGN|nr:hypothetical protein NE237_002613 [Protea cynaroides]